eukprot:SAG31_NODE_331_length_17518_cov_32.495042_12_plen_171_part_00
MAAVRLTPLLLAAALAAAGEDGEDGGRSDIGRGNAAACPGKTYPHCGLTDGKHIYNSSASPSFSACCAKCASDPSGCAAWIFVAADPESVMGPGTCKLRHTRAQCRPDLPNHISGYLGPSPSPLPPPHPQPPSPPPPPVPPAAGRKPHIVLLVVDDWGWSNVGYHRKSYR